MRPIGLIQRVCIKLLGVFGAACAFFGFLFALMATSILVEDGQHPGIREEQQWWLLLGLSLLSLGIPHILAAFVLQKRVDFADEVLGRPKPGFVRLFATSLVLPSLLLIASQVTWDNAGPNPMIKLFFVTSVAWFAGIALVFLRRLTEPGAARVLATSLIVPFSIVVAILSLASHMAEMKPVYPIFLLLSFAWIAGVAIVFLRFLRDLEAPKEMTAWDRTYIRWGWFVLLAMVVTIATFAKR